MKLSEARRVHVNSCLLDEELAEIRKLCEGAEPGEWQVKGDEMSETNPLAVTRYNGEPVRSRGSFALMAAAVGVVPRLLKGVRVLEEALRLAWIDAASWKRDYLEERRAREEDARRRSEGKTGDDHELRMLAGLAKLGACSGERLEGFLRTWAGGGSVNVGGALLSELRFAEKRHAERESASAAVDAEVEDLRRKLRERLAQIDSGAQPAGSRSRPRSKRKATP